MPDVIIIKDGGVQGPPGPAGPSTPTGSLLTTASVNLNTITFTKGDGTTFPITVNTGSGGSGGSTFPYTGSAVITGSLTVTGSTVSTQGFTGSLQGTSSYSNQSLSSSYALTASFALNGGGGGNSGFIFATTDDQLNIFSKTYLDGVTPTRIITGSINEALTYTGQFQMFEIINVSRQLGVTLNTYGDTNITSSMNITDATDLSPGTYFSAPSGSYFSSITFGTSVGNQSIRVYEQIPQPPLLEDGLFTTSSVIISKKLYVYEDVEVFGGITGSLHGTSSHALTASYALNANTQGGSGFPFSGSAVITGSIVAGNTPFSIINNTVRYNQTSSISSSIISLEPKSNLIEQEIVPYLPTQFTSYTITPQTIFIGTEFKIFIAIEQFVSLDSVIGTRFFYTGSTTDIYGITGYRYVGNITGWNISNISTEAFTYALTASSVTATTLTSPSSFQNFTNELRFFTSTGSGIVNLQGYVTASKSLLVNGPTTINGSTSISGSTNIRGLTTITGSLNTSGSVNVRGQVSASSYIGSGNLLSGIVANPMFENLVVSASITATGSLSSNGANALNLGTTNFQGKTITLGQIETVIAGSPNQKSDTNIITLNRNLNEINTSTHTQINFDGRYWEYFPGPELYDAYADTGNHYLKFISKNTQTGNITGKILDLQFSTKDTGSGNSKGFSTDYNGTAYFNITGSVSASAYYGNGSTLSGVVLNPFTGSLLATGSINLIGILSSSIANLDTINSTNGINGVYISEGSGSRSTNLVIGDTRALSTISGTGTSGQNLIAIGSGSLIAATTTFRNIALGNNVLPTITANGSNNNIGIGFDVLTTGSNSLTNNIAIGNSASYAASSGDNNIAIGTEALFSNATNNNNIAIGLRAGRSATGAVSSIFIGVDAGANVTSGDNNIAIGFEALKLLTSVGNNIAIGFQAMVSGSGAQDSIAIGSSALRSITTGDDNLAIGANTLATITTAAGNLAIGSDSMISSSATLASNNTSIGFQSLQQITGSNNVALGYRTMQGFRSGSNNTVIGYNNVSGSGVSGSNNTIIGANVVLPDGVHNNRIIIADGRGTQIITTSGSLTTISGSLTATSFTGSFTGSIIATGSFTGSIFATGRVSQTVGALSIVSTTASLDLSRGNFFTLTLAAGAVTHINPTNITAGQTTTVLITTDIGSDVTFPSSVKQQSGSAYVTSPGIAKDILTFISYDTSNVYVANVKNLI
jgi:hypothetical protein